MFRVCKEMEIAGGHHLELPYTSKCSNLHGHNWIIKVWCCARKLSSYGMVLDFAHIKRLVDDKYDHKYLNDILEHESALTAARGELNPTAENIAYKIFKDINSHLEARDDNFAVCYKVQVQESRGNTAEYERSDKWIKYALDKKMKSTEEV